MTRAKPTTPSPWTYPEYVSQIGHGGQIGVLPGAVEGARTAMFVFRADTEKAQAFVDHTLNAGTRQGLEFHVLGTEATGCLLIHTWLDGERLYSLSRPDLGHSSSRETAFWLPLAYRARGCRKRQWKVAFWMPYIWIDNSIGKATGREIWGYPKELGTIDTSQEPDAQGIISWSVSTRLLSGGQTPRYSREEQRLISLRIRPSHEAESAFLVQPDQDEWAMTFEDTLAYEESHLPIYGEARPGKPSRATGWLPVETLWDDLRRVPVINLKQFRAADDGRRSSQTSLTHHVCELVDVRQVGVIDGSFSLSLTPCQNHPIAEDLGISDRHPVAGFFTDMDFHIQPGEPLWRPPSSPTRIAIVGGSLDALATAFYLSNTPKLREQYEITIYQRGWRLGDGGASEYQPWLGCEQHALALVRDCYRTWQPPRDSELRRWRDAFQPDRDALGWPWNELLDESTAPPQADATGPTQVAHRPPAPWRSVIRGLELTFGWALPRLLDRAAYEHPQLTQYRSMPCPLPAGLAHHFHLALVHTSPATQQAFFRTLAAPSHADVLGQRGCSERELAFWAESLEHQWQMLFWWARWLPGLPSKMQRQHRAHMRELSAHVRNHFASHLLSPIARPAPILKAAWELLQVVAAVVDGLLAPAYKLWPEGQLKGLGALSLRQWLLRHELPSHGYASPPLALFRRLASTHVLKPQDQRTLSAQQAIAFLLRLLSAQGPLLLRPSVGLGAGLLAPLYQTLRQQGVRIRFFCEAHAIERTYAPDRALKLWLRREEELRGATYEPLAWPDDDGARHLEWLPQPDRHQLEPPAFTGSPREDEASPRSQGPFVEQLDAGIDFDHLIFGAQSPIPIHFRDERWGDVLRSLLPSPLRPWSRLAHRARAGLAQMTSPSSPGHTRVTQEGSPLHKLSLWTDDQTAPLKADAAVLAGKQLAQKIAGKQPR